MGFNSGFKGLI